MGRERTKDNDVSNSEDYDSESDDDENFAPIPTSLGRSFFLYAVVPLGFMSLVSVFGRVAEVPFERDVSSTARPRSAPRSPPPPAPATATRSSSRTKTKSSRATTPIPEEIGNMLPKKEEEERNPKPTKPRRKPRRRPERATSSSNRDETHQRFESIIEERRDELESDPDDYTNILALADVLRERQFAISDGGRYQGECIAAYRRGLSFLYARSRRDDNDPILLSEIATAETNLAKVYFVANMFERAVEACDRALNAYPDALDAINFRANSLLILGRYEESSEAYLRLLRHPDTDLPVPEAASGLARILTARASAVPGGWDGVVARVREVLPLHTHDFEAATGDGRQRTAGLLTKLHLALFAWHDHETDDRDAAFHHLETACRRRIEVLPPYPFEVHRRNVDNTLAIFGRSFFESMTHLRGSPSRTPVFIIGFVRSGSTLLERVLDAHPDVVGMGEDSVFNGRLEEIRTAIVEASSLGMEDLDEVVAEQAKTVLRETEAKWRRMKRNQEEEENFDEYVDGGSNLYDEDEDVDDDTPAPKRFVDKMLMNYNNIGFIHMLFPKALILHVAREPMDSVFSAYKHEFEANLQYTSDPKAVVAMYRNYRDLIDHWDTVLPGRITHVRYEDMVDDMPRAAQGIIKAAGLRWDESVLDFHKKRHAVNTMSSTQVRKGVYRHSLNYWKRYENHLRPIVEMMGERTRHDVRTTLLGYDDDDESAKVTKSKTKKKKKKRASTT